MFLVVRACWLTNTWQNRWEFSLSQRCNATVYFGKCFCTLKIKSAGSSAILETIYQTKRCHDQYTPISVAEDAAYYVQKCRMLWHACRSEEAVRVMHAWSVLFNSLVLRQLPVSQRPRGLSHELSLPNQTLFPWVRIPLEACMSVCVYSVRVVL
jgi:hypothetical protein